MGETRQSADEREQIAAELCAMIHSDENMTYPEMADRILAALRRQPATESAALEAIAGFAAHQNRHDRHPYTCGRRSGHPVRWGDEGVLYAALQPDGTPILVCPDCDYTQPFPGWPAPTEKPSADEPPTEGRDEG